MLFDERPKDRKEDLFDREREVEEIINNIKRPLLLISGVRRIGKTSVLLVSLNEAKENYILIDCRKLKENYGRKELYSLFSEALSSKISYLKDVLEKVKGISIAGNYVEIKWGGKNYISLSSLFDELNKKRLIIAIDEAQRLRGPLSKEIKDAIAHAYDYDRNLTFILTGSEVGLLHELIDVENENSPVYGRYYLEITLDRFNKERSKEFLQRGFQEISIKVEDKIIEEIVNYFDGIPGWLTFAGNEYATKGKIEEVKKTAVKVAKGELENLIEEKTKKVSYITGKRYRNALKCIAKGENSWSKLLSCMEKEEGSTISTSVLDNIIQNLEKMSIIKDYEFLDPVYKEASKLL
ncbi:archaeal ATPase [Acidianus hospitalis W1]|uniref:Archaeal ATPase n=1 Tax=Acidianus hospitalis (strain W1) TaxID=933801 RepID=F4B525_ACIHW|nr:ATP-binding protein [Acidianus hospitalis]AEE94327.1 archaeal ATPase [Acidianus hospitalis W1]